MTRYGVMVVGSGFGAQVHVPIVEKHPAFTVAGLIGQRPNSGFQEMSARLDVPYFHGLEEWLRSSKSADLLVVATPPTQHAEFVIGALKRGMRVLAEKPLATNATEAAHLVMLAESLGLQGWTNFEFRMLEIRRKVVELLTSGDVIGRPLSFYWIQGGSGYSAYSSRPTGWVTERGMGGGYLGALGSHMLDYLLWLFGEVDTVQATEVIDVKERGDGENRAEDGFTVIMRFVSGVSGVIHYRAASRTGLGSVLEITGTDGGYRLINDKILYTFDQTGTLNESLVEDGECQTKNLGYRCTEQIYDLIAEELGGHSVGIPTLRDGWQVQRVLDAIRLSHETGIRCGVS